MKGFLSLLGIMLIVGAFGLILLSFTHTPLEELKKQERMQAYMETRQNHKADSANRLTTAPSAVEHSPPLQVDYSHTNPRSCENPAFTEKRADSN